MANEFLNDLNKEQYEAATTTEGPLLILAGAGTGKTKTLVSRTAYIVKGKMVDPEKVLLLTFTNKAANEMKERICKMIDGMGGEKITACTFHSFCAEFLRSNAHLLDYEKNSFTILSDDDAKEIVTMYTNEKRKELESKGYSYRSFPSARQIIGINSKSVNDLISISDAIASDISAEGFRKEVQEVIETYMNYKKERNMMDYDDLLMNTVLILKNFPEIRKTMSEKYSYIMCDEYQDTNRIQDEILDMLCTVHNNLAVVGDDNQSIYKFRGARIENIMTFEVRHPGCKQIVLYENYRSSQENLDFCNAVMSHASEGIRKDLHGQFHGQRPRIDVYNSKNEEAYNIVEQALKYHNAGIPFNDMAVLVRSTQASALVESILTKRGIPFVKYGGQKFFSKEIIRNIFGFLRAAISDTDEIAWYLMLKIYPLIGEERAKMFSALVAKDRPEALLGFEFSRYKYYKSMQEAYETIITLRSKDLMGQLKYLIDDYYRDLMGRYIDESRINGNKKVELMQKLESDLIEASVLFDLAEGYMSARDFIDDMTLSFSNPEANAEDPIVISTIHSAKGLEFNTVFLVDPLDGEFPRCKAGDDDDAEELRCLYVALTRAKEHLHVCVSKYGAKYGNPTETSLSHHLAYNDVVEAADSNANVKDMFPGRKIETFRYQASKSFYDRSRRARW